MDDAYVKSILKECGCDKYPSDFSDKYEAMECLSSNENDMTLLVKEKVSGQLFAAKCYMEKSLLSNLNEADILKRLTHPGLPRFKDVYQNDNMLCVVREYIQGSSLDKYINQCPVDERRAVELAEGLCDILTYLHGHNPPVIHRDIKPQNIIIDTKGRVCLIDFGISRVYDSTAAEDTVFYGTKYFAAPEQYGFAQTDMRTDVFSFGILLGWLLTGECQIKNILVKIKNRNLLHVVKRCSAFAPEKRFASAEKIKKALKNGDGHKQKRIVRWVCTGTACLACLCAGFILGRFSELEPAVFSDEVRFSEPLIEQAVRMELGIDENQPVLKSDLLNITELYIYGDKAAEDSPAFEELGNHMANNDGVLKNGGIDSLNDIRKMKNLKILRIALQDISDISPLADLESLEIIDLRHNPLEDISPLAFLPRLQVITLYETHVSDISALSSCPMLSSVNAGKTRITSLAALSGLTGIIELDLRDVSVKSLDGIEFFTSLEYFRISDVADSNLRPLLSLPYLKEVYLGGPLSDTAAEQLADCGFTIVY